MPYCVGLTGGIGSGKSSAARIFASLGAGMVDVDDISHVLTRPGGAAIADIRSQFGAEAIATDGSLNRARMRELIFADASAKQRLEAILHPMIGAQARAAVAASPSPYVMLVVPLLLERDTYGDVTQRVAVVDCTEQHQIERTMRRSAISEDAVRAIMAAQLSRAQRLAKADDVINNDGGEDELRRQVCALHERYLTLAAAHRPGSNGTQSSGG
jgi:dephospho-CoA kinase